MISELRGVIRRLGVAGESAVKPKPSCQLPVRFTVPAVPWLLARLVYPWSARLRPTSVSFS